LTIFMLIGKSNGNGNNTSKTKSIVSDLESRGFKRSVLHRTVGKLQSLIRLSRTKSGDASKYHEYLRFFKALHDSTGLSKLFVLKLCSAEDLMAMEVSILIDNVTVIRRAFVHGDECNLTSLPDLYPEMISSST
jgi:hypothetical protein